MSLPSINHARTRHHAVLGASVLLVGTMLATLSASAENGNISPSAIEIDTSANLYPSPATKCNASPDNTFDQAPGASKVDWVKDCLPLTPTTDFTAANTAALRGHLNGFRVVDGVAGGDQDIFLMGGKEQDLSTWHPGPGSVGSSKYDITQAYIANNTSSAFFGMERRGNNGTTAFDWEFNVKAPSAATPDYIPTRSECDVLVTFEMQGSGRSGSAEPFLFRYDDPDTTVDCTDSTAVKNAAADSDLDGAYAPVSSVGINARINEGPVEAAPWGYVDSHGNWVLGQLDKFEFAEASVPLSLLGISSGDTCSAISRYMQVRTRSSSTDTSDLKDLTKIRNFEFFAPTNPTQTLSENCDAKFDFDSSIDAPKAVPTWTFSVPAPGDEDTGITLTGEGTLSLTDGGIADGKHSWSAAAYNGEIAVGGFPNGVDSVTVGVSQSSTSGGCAVSSNGSIVVHRGLGITASLTPQCGNAFDYSASSTGGVGPKTYAWSFQKLTPGSDPALDASWSEVATSATQSGSIDMDSVAGGGQGTYRGVATVSDSADNATGKPSCQKTVTTSSVTVYDALSATASMTPDCDAIFAWSVDVDGGKAPYDIQVDIQKKTGPGVDDWTTQCLSAGCTHTYSYTDDADGDVNNTFDATGSPGRYRVKVHAEDSQAVGTAGVACTIDLTSTEREVRNALVATAAKATATTVRNTLTAGLDGDETGDLAGDTLTHQWQVSVDGGDFTDISGKTTVDTTYNSFKTDELTPDDVDFAVSGDSYLGRVWSVRLRLHVVRTVDGIQCADDSEPVTVKIIEGVDP